MPGSEAEQWCERGLEWIGKLTTDDDLTMPKPNLLELSASGHYNAGKTIRRPSLGMNWLWNNACPWAPAIDVPFFFCMYAYMASAFRF